MKKEMITGKSIGTKRRKILLHRYQLIHKGSIIHLCTRAQRLGQLNGFIIHRRQGKVSQNAFERMDGLKSRIKIAVLYRRLQFIKIL